MKKSLLLALVITTLLALLCGTAQAATSGQCGYDLTWYITGQTLYISGTGPMYDYGPGTSSLYGNTQFTDVFVRFNNQYNDEMTVGDYAFENCTSFVTHIWMGFDPVSIGKGAYLGCTSLANYYIKPCTVSIGEGAFGNCISIDQFHKYGQDELNFEIIDNALYDKEVKRLIAYPPANAATTCVIPDGVTRIGDYAFCNCKNLQRIEVPASVTEIGAHAFEGVTAEIVLADGICIRSFGNGAFTDCASLSGHLTLADGITEIGADTFRGCANLTSITLPDTLTSIGARAFQGCTGLTGVSLPDKVDRIGEYAFQGCEALTLPDGLPDSLYYIYGHAFDGCASITSLDIDGADIREYAFANCTGLTSVSLSSYVNIIGNNVFDGCTSLAQIDMPEALKYGTSEYLFKNCTSLQSIHIPLFTGQGNMVPANFLNGCTNLTTVYLPADLAGVRAEAFQNCGALTDIYFDGTPEQWSALTIEAGNDILTSSNVTVHYTDNYIPFGSIFIEITGQGTVVPNTQIAELGDTVRLTVEPAEGYLLSSIVVTDSMGRGVDLHQNKTYRFKHTSKYVTVKAKFEPVSACVGGTEANPIPLTADEFPTFLFDGWYELTENATISSRIMIQGDVHLILQAGKTLIATSGIGVNEGNTLTISGSGTLNAMARSSGACIGASANINGGTIIINGGTIIATESNGGGAGIGGYNRSFEAIIINGGTITAKGSWRSGSESSGNIVWDASAGIGGAARCECGSITINGGVIHAVGGYGAPGIGGGTVKNVPADCDITIADGLKVTVKDAASPALYADRADACLANVVDIAPCTHDGDGVVLPTGETACAYCNVAHYFPALGSGTAADPWIINSAARWNMFASAVENGLSTSGKYFKLTKDISITTMLGTSANPFGGHFDGVGHTLTVNLTASDSGKGPFAFVSGASFVHLRVAGTITTSVHDTGGLVGQAAGGCTITDCVSDVHIVANGGNGHAGFVGSLSGNVAITGSAFTGSIVGARTSYCAGFAGAGGGTVDDSVYDGTISGISNNNTFLRQKDRAENCYYTNLNGIDRVKGNQALAVTADEGVTMAFGKPLATYPTSGITAYPAGLAYNGVFYAGKGQTVTLGLSSEPREGSATSFTASAGTLTRSGDAWTLTMPAEAVVISAVYIPAFGTPDFALPAFLTTVEEEAFEGIAASVVDIPESCVSIGAHAFRNCPNLTQIRIPDGCTLGTDVFDSCEMVYVYGTAGSSAEAYCSTHANCEFVPLE